MAHNIGLNRSSSLLLFDQERESREPREESYTQVPQGGGAAQPLPNEATTSSVGGVGQEDENALPLIDTLRARTFVGTVIVVDLFCLGAEADYPGSYWAAVEVVLVVFYVIEMALRMHAQGLQMFVPSELVLGREYKTKTPTVILNYFRLLLVLLGIIDSYVWVMDFVEWRSFFMYLRLLRVVRIFNLFDVLTRFVMALLYMTHNLSWIFCVIALVSYVSAVFFTLYAKEHDLEDAQEFFPDVWSSAFSLFQVTTMDNWHDIAVPLVNYHGAWGVFFVVFIAFTSWTMISLLTAVVSEQIILATRDMQVRETEMHETRQRNFVSFLRKCFVHADADSNGVLDKQEFTNLIQEEIVTRKFAELGVILQHEELQDTFDMLDVDESGELTADEFTVGLSQLQQSLGIKHVLSINYAIQRIHRKLSKQLQAHTQGAEEHFGGVTAKVDSLALKMASREHFDARMDRLEQRISDFGEMMKKQAQGRTATYSVFSSGGKERAGSDRDRSTAGR